MENTIKVERAILNLTQRDLAEKIGVSRQTINSIEANRYVPSTVLALKLSKVFNKPVNDFFKLSENDEIVLRVSYKTSRLSFMPSVAGFAITLIF